MSFWSKLFGKKKEKDVGIKPTMIAKTDVPAFLAGKSVPMSKATSSPSSSSSMRSSNEVKRENDSFLTDPLLSPLSPISPWNIYENIGHSSSNCESESTIKAEDSSVKESVSTSSSVSSYSRSSSWDNDSCRSSTSSYSNNDSYGDSGGGSGGGDWDD